MPLQPKNTPPYYEANNAVKKYVALLTQTGTDAPVATVLENTLGVELTYQYDIPGVYLINSPTGIFIPDKTFISITAFQNQFVSAGNMELNPSTQLYVQTGLTNGVLTDNQLYNNSIEIRVYP